MLDGRLARSPAEHLVAGESVSRATYAATASTGGRRRPNRRRRRGIGRRENPRSTTRVSSTGSSSGRMLRRIQRAISRRMTATATTTTIPPIPSVIIRSASGFGVSGIPVPAFGGRVGGRRGPEERPQEQEADDDPEEDQEAPAPPREARRGTEDQHRAEREADENRDRGAGDGRERQAGGDHADQQEDREGEPGRVPAPVDAPLVADRAEPGEGQGEDGRSMKRIEAARASGEEPTAIGLDDDPAEECGEREARRPEGEEPGQRAFGERQARMGEPAEHREPGEKAARMCGHRRPETRRQAAPCRAGREQAGEAGGDHEGEGDGRPAAAEAGRGDMGDGRPIATSTASWAIPISGWWSVNSWTSPPTTEIHAASAMQTRTSGMSSTTRATAPGGRLARGGPRVGCSVGRARGASAPARPALRAPRGDSDAAVMAVARSARPPPPGRRRRRGGRRSATARRAGRTRADNPAARARAASAPASRPQATKHDRAAGPLEAPEVRARYGDGSRARQDDDGRARPDDPEDRREQPLERSDDGWDDSRASRSRTRSSWPGASDGGSIANRLSAPW